MMHIEITDREISPDRVVARLDTSGSGAVVVFTGIVRPWEGGERIERLHYEHYPEMAMKGIRDIVEASTKKWKLIDAAVEHRFGDVSAGDVSVVVAVSSERRNSAFAGCSEIIERIKHEVPIWKKDIGGRTQWQSERS